MLFQGFPNGMGAFPRFSKHNGRFSKVFQTQWVLFQGFPNGMGAWKSAYAGWKSIQKRLRSCYCFHFLRSPQCEYFALMAHEECLKRTHCGAFWAAFAWNCRNKNITRMCVLSSRLWRMPRQAVRTGAERCCPRCVSCCPYLSGVFLF